MNVLQREHWNGQPTTLGRWFEVKKNRRAAVCTIVTHPLGWELRLEVDGDLRRSQVCRTEREIFDTGDGWKGKMLEKGWS